MKDCLDQRGKYRENTMHLLLIQNKNLKERKKGNTLVVRIKGRNTISSQLSLITSPIVLRLGWWIVELPEI